MKNYLIIIVLVILVASSLNAQTTDQNQKSNLLEDPYLSLKPFNTIDASVAYQYVNSNNISFGDYTLKRGKYYPSASMAAYIHIPNLFQMKNPYGKGKAIGNLKTGFLMDFTSTDLYYEQKNEIGLYDKKEMTFSQVSVSIPLIYSHRMPINHGNEKGNKYYKAINVNFGLYLGVPVSNRLYEKGDITPENGEIGFGDYLRWGSIIELEYSALNKEGYGHRFGLRMITDFSSVIKFNKEKYGIYPTYVSAGIYYNMATM